MFQDPDDQSTTTYPLNLQTVFADVLKRYKKWTKEDIAAHSLATQIESCNSPNAVLTVLQTQVRTFDPSPSANERWTRLLHPTITVLYAFSGLVSNIAGPISPPVISIFTGIGVLLQTIKDVRAAQDVLINLYRMKLFFMQLEKYIDVQPTAAMTDVIVKIFVEVISILGIVTKEIGHGRFQKYVKKLFGLHRLEESFRRLNKFTLDILTIATRTDEILIYVHQLQGVHTNIHGVVHEVDFVDTGVPREEIQTVSKHVSDPNGYESRKDLRRWNNPPDYSSNFYTASDAHHEGTAAWCIKGNTFADWLASGSLFWIHGKPGSGKTILSSVIIRHIESLPNSGSVFLAYFYFDCKDIAKQDSRALLTSLLEQLSNQSDQLCDVLRGLYSKHHDGSEQPSNDALLRCLKGMLTIARSVPIYVVMDALDECPNDSGSPSREKVLNVVEELIKLRLPNLRLCITSRPELDIRAIIKPLATQEISLHDESGQNRDINAYVTFVAQSVKHWRDDDKKMIADKLMEDADGMFRWVYCKLDVLRQCHRNDLRRILKELPRSLDETYQRILKEINDANSNQAHRLLQCLVAALRPLQVEELVDVLALDVDARGIPRFNTKSRWEDHEAAVLSTCSSLVSVVNHDGSRVVQLCHTSVKEFLMSDRLSATEDISQFHISHESSHAILAQACLGILLSADDLTSENSTRDIPFSRYAYEYWLEHVQVGNVELQLMDALDHFFDLDKPHFEIFFRAPRARVPFKLDFFWASSDEESNGAVSPAAPFYFAATSKLSGLAERLIVAKKPQVLKFCGNKGTLLHLAVRQGHTETARLLLAHGADINSRKDYTALPCIASLQRYSQGLESRSEKLLGSGLDAIDDINALLDTDVNIRSEENSDRDIGLGESHFTPLHLAALEGHLDTCQMLLERNADVRGQDDSGDTPLHLAVSSHHIEIVRVLLEYNAEVNSQNKDGLTPLLIASSRGNIDILCLLLAHNADVFVHDNRGSSPLHIAATRGDLEVSRNLLEFKANINALDDGGSTPLHQALQGWRRGDPDIAQLMQLLLDNGADLHACDNSGNTPLHFAVSKGHLEVARMLLKQKAKVNSQNDEGFTPLQRASQVLQEGKSDIIRLLLDYGANVNMYDKRGNTPLHFAVSEHHFEVANMLLMRGANVDSQNDEGLTPLQRASQGMREGYPIIMRLLLDHGANWNARDHSENTALHFAASKGHVARIELEIDFDSQKDKRLTSLQQTSKGIWERDQDIVRLLLDYGANVNLPNKSGNTALHFAASEGHLEAAHMLLERGADVNSLNDEVLIPLQRESQGLEEGYQDIMRLSSDHVMNWNACDNNGNTALHLAAFEGHLEVAHMLLERGVNINSLNNEGLAPIQRALQGMREGYLDVMHLLLDYGANCNACNNSRNTALHFAASEGHLEAVRSLLERNAEVNSQNDDGSTPLLLASELGFPDLVQLFLDHDADVHVCDADGDTALHCAAIGGQLEVSRLLLKLDVKVNSQNNEGWTPLHLASACNKEGNLGLVRLLLNHGADARARNLSGETASEVVRGPRQDEVVQLLSQHTAE